MMSTKDLLTATGIDSAFQCVATEIINSKKIEIGEFYEITFKIKINPNHTVQNNGKFINYDLCDIVVTQLLNK